MAKKTSKRAKPTVITTSGKVQQIDSRKLQALYIYNQINPTQLQLANFFSVSVNTIKNWLADAKKVIDGDDNMVEMAKIRFQTMVPQALDVYHKALEIGSIFPKSEHIGAAKDVLKERLVITDKSESPTTNINVNVIVEKRQTALEAGLNAFGCTLNRMVTNGSGPADPSSN